MSYTNPIAITYNFAAVDFGAGTVTKKLRPPTRCNGGRVAGIHAAATEAFTQTTTQGLVQVGKAGALGKFAELGMGATALGASRSDKDEANSLKGSFNLDAEGITELTLTMVAPTGGTPAGIADVAVTIEWF